MQADDAVKTSEEELGFAVASYGEEATADFRTALDGAKAKVAEAFSLQQRLDDAEPDTDEERRAWYGGIIRLAGEADALLDEQADRFDALRALERNAPAELQRVQAEAAAAAERVAPATQRLASLTAQYAASAVAPVADNPAQAEARLAFARQELDEATAAVAAGRANDAAVGIRAAEESVDQAVLLSDAVERLATDLATADQAVAAGVADLEHDVQTGRGLGDANAAALAERVAADAAAIRATMTSTGRDPLVAHARIEQVNAEIDAAIAGARDAAVRQERAQAQLGRSLATARAQVQAAEDYLVARRGAVGAEARTRLAEAGRLLVEAEGTGAGRPGGRPCDGPACRVPRRHRHVARPAGRRRVRRLRRRRGRRLRRSPSAAAAAATCSARCSAGSSSTPCSAAAGAAACSAAAAAAASAAASAAADGVRPAASAARERGRGAGAEADSERPDPIPTTHDVTT